MSSRTVGLKKLVSPFPCSLQLSLLPWFSLVMTDDVVVGLPSHKLDYSGVASLKLGFKKICVFCLQVLVGGFLRNWWRKKSQLLLIPRLLPFTDSY